MSLQQYIGLDFGKASASVQDLAGRMDGDLQSPVLVISSDHEADASSPPFLTRGMWEWYRKFVEFRRQAVEELRGAFAVIQTGRSGNGFLFEFERDAIWKRRNAAIREERRQFFQRQDVQSLKTKIEKERVEYERLRRRAGDRDPIEWDRRVYIGLMTAIALPEAVLNFRTFANMPMAFMTDAIALALTIIIAIVIAFSSDVIGETFKQWRELFGGGASETNKGIASLKFTAAWAAFVMAIGIVSGGRYTLFASDIQRKLVTGDILGFNDFLPFGITVGGNILIFVFGVFIAIAAHEQIPGYGRTARRLAALEDKRDKLYRSILERRVQRHQAAAQNELSTLEERQHQFSSTGPDYSSKRALFERFVEADRRVIALLDAYRGELIRRSSTQGAKISFVMTDLDNIDERSRRELTSEEYLLCVLRLPLA